METGKKYLDDFGKFYDKLIRKNNPSPSEVARYYHHREKYYDYCMGLTVVSEVANLKYDFKDRGRFGMKASASHVIANKFNQTAFG